MQSADDDKKEVLILTHSMFVTMENLLTSACYASPKTTHALNALQCAKAEVLQAINSDLIFDRSEISQTNPSLLKTSEGFLN